MAFGKEKKRMREYLCECLSCHNQHPVRFEEPFPEAGDVFEHFCKTCGCITKQTRVLTRKARAEMRTKEAEQDLRQSIVDKCESYGFQCRFLYESVIITTPISSWQFGYHSNRKTLRHESTVKINFETGGYAKTHEQFHDRKMSCAEVIDYIAAHDKWRQEQSEVNTDAVSDHPK